MDAFFIPTEIFIVAATAIVLVLLGHALRRLTYREGPATPRPLRTPVPLRSGALRARPVGR